ncbi:MAG: S41 family peptidase [Bacteroidota bacterium]|nr:S41 family peptidase [Bacteroidota bacterium]
MRFKIIGLCLIGLVLSSSALLYDRYFEITKNIEIFANVYKEINSNYVDQTDPSKLMKAGIDAMLNTLDPFTNYISEAQIESYRINVEGRYNGVGARAKKMGDYVTITEIYKDYPAYKAGLKVGDQVIAVNGQSAKGKESEDLYQIMRGIPKSDVDITIIRPGVPGQQSLKLVRDEVNIPNVPYSGMISEGIGYLILTSFTENAGSHVQAAVKKLKEENPNLKGIIFDLRDNGGGLLHEAVEVCNTFIAQGQLIASTRSKAKERDQYFKTTRPAVDEIIPVVVLINNKSASASEIVSGSIQDLDRGVLIGQISYGKGLVQNTKDVGYNAKVKLTISKYYIPSGRCIQSVHYDNGQPVHLPDSLRVPFKTKNGRLVYDGGGVKPDLELAEAINPIIVQKLLDDNWIFNFCTVWSLKNPAPNEARNFEFVAFDDFLAYLKKEKFDDLSALELKLKEFESEAKKEKASEFYGEVESMHKQLQLKQWLDINENKQLISNLIEEEIVGRVFFEEGKIQKRLAHDKLIAEAKLLINDRKKYDSILVPGK